MLVKANTITSIDRSALTASLQSDIDDQLVRALLDRCLTDGEKSTREYVEGALNDWGERRHLIGVIGAPPRTPSDTHETDYKAFCEWTIIQIEEYYDQQNQQVQMVMRQHWVESPKLNDKPIQYNADSCMMSYRNYCRYLKNIRDQVTVKLFA